jgi:general secretion pathway protein A
MEYRSFYQLSEDPFTLTPDPRYLFLSENYQEVLSTVADGVTEQKGFVVLLGEVGTGKTTLVRHLLGQFGPHIQTAFIFNAINSLEDLLQMVLHDLDVACQSRNRSEMINALNEYALEEAAAGRYVVLIIDEAQRLSTDILEEFRMLSNLETPRRKLLQIILVGQPELRENLMRADLRQFRQRIGVVAELWPLTLRETDRYVAHRLRVAGGVGNGLFTRRSLRQIHKASHGIPRLINAICGRALAVGYDRQARQIDHRLIKVAVGHWAVLGDDAFAVRASSRAWSTTARQRQARRVRRWAAATTLGLLALSLLLGMMQQNHAFMQRLSHTWAQAAAWGDAILDNLSRAKEEKTRPPLSKDATDAHQSAPSDRELKQR